MSIQQDILDTIGNEGIEIGALQNKVGNVGANELDCAVTALIRARRVRVVDNRYEVIPSTRHLGQMHTHGDLPPSAEEEAAASLRPAISAKSLAKRSTVNGSGGAHPADVRPAEPSAPSVAASTHPTLAPSVIDRVQERRQKALNRIALLEVEGENLWSEVRDCEKFLELYERFAASAN